MIESDDILLIFNFLNNEIIKERHWSVISLVTNKMYVNILKLIEKLNMTDNNFFYCVNGFYVHVLTPTPADTVR